MALTPEEIEAQKKAAEDKSQDSGNDDGAKKPTEEELAKMLKEAQEIIDAQKKHISEVNAEAKDRRLKLKESVEKLAAYEQAEAKRRDQMEKDKQLAEEKKREEDRAQMTDAERAQADMDARFQKLEEMLGKAVSAVDTVTAKYGEAQKQSEESAKAEVLRKAMGEYKFRNPEVVAKLVDSSAIPMKDGKPDAEAAAQMVKEVVDAEPYLLETPAKEIGNLPDFNSPGQIRQPGVISMGAMSEDQVEQQVQELKRIVHGNDPAASKQAASQLLVIGLAKAADNAPGKVVKRVEKTLADARKLMGI